MMVAALIPTMPFKTMGEQSGLVANLRFVAQVAFKDVLAWWAQKQETREYNQWCEIQRDEKNAPEVQATVPTPQSHKNTQTNIDGDIHRGEGRHAHVVTVSVGMIRRSYINVFGLTILVRGTELQ